MTLRNRFFNTNLSKVLTPLRVMFVIAAVGIMAAGMCGCGSDDAPAMTSIGVTDSITTPLDTLKIPGDTILDDPFVAYNGPIEPLSAEVRPILTENKQWIYYNCFNEPGHSDYKTQAIKFGLQRLPENNEYSDSGIVYLGDRAFREREDGWLEYYDVLACDESLAWAPLCKIPAEKSDSIVSICQSMYPISQGTITLMGKTRRCVKVWCARNMDWRYMFWDSFISPYNYWVEGIGMLYIHYTTNSNIRSGFNGYPVYQQLLQCWDGDEKIYDYREFSDDLYKPEEVFAQITDWPQFYNDDNRPVWPKGK